MRKGISYAAVIAVFLLAAAEGFSDSFSVTETYGGTNGHQLNFGNHDDGFSDPFLLTVSFDPLLNSFISANLDIGYSEVSEDEEVWAAWASNTGGTPSPGDQAGYESLGILTGYEDDDQHTLSFDMTGHVPGIPESGLGVWTLYVSFRETTPGVDKMRLFSMSLYGDYSQYVPSAFPQGDIGGQLTHAPEPASLLLLGTGLGLMGIIAMRRKK